MLAVSTANGDIGFSILFLLMAATNVFFVVKDKLKESKNEISSNN
jgi:hypothetical protein